MTYRLRYAFEYKMGGYVPVDGDRPHFMWRGTRVRTIRGVGRTVSWKITENPDEAYTWKTREGVEKMLARVSYDRLANADGVKSHFVIEEVPA